MQRLDKESNEDYKVRRNKFNAWQKHVLNRAFWVWKSKYEVPINKLLDKNYVIPKDAESKGTYVKPKTNTKTSFTQDLRNQKGYANHLSKRY